MEEVQSKPYKIMYHNSWKQAFELGFNLLFDSNKLRVINKIIDSRLLDTCCIVSSGLVPYEVGKGTPKQSREDLKSRIYDASHQIDNTYLNYIVGGSIFKYSLTPSTTNWIKFGDNLAAPRKNFNFFQKKIMVRQTSDRIISAIDTVGYISLKSVHNIVISDSNLTYELLLCILNSKLIDFYYKFLVPEEGRTFAEVKAVNLKRLPITRIDEDFNQEPFIEKTHDMIEVNKKLQESKQNFINELELEKIPKKLQNFETLDFDGFIKEYKKAKKLKFANKLEERNFKDEWRDLFENDKKVVTELQAQIDATDREIDLMVYELYGLSEDEVALVEGI